MLKRENMLSRMNIVFPMSRGLIITQDLRLCGGREGECSNDTLNKWRKGAGGKQFVLRRLLLVVVGQQGEIVLHP